MHAVDGIELFFYDNDSCTSFSYEEVIQLLRLDKADTLN